MGGVEGQYYTSNIPFDGALSYAATSDGYNYDLWSARVAGAYFINPNFDINATISYTDWDHYSDTVTGYGVGAAYRFSGSRFSFPCTMTVPSALTARTSAPIRVVK